jgi:hypothetical protein
MNIGTATVAWLYVVVLVISVVVVAYRLWREHRCRTRGHAWITTDEGHRCGRCHVQMSVGDRM